MEALLVRIEYRTEHVWCDGTTGKKKVSGPIYPVATQAA
jgi:hypothetical protein